MMVTAADGLNGAATRTPAEKVGRIAWSDDAPRLLAKHYPAARIRGRLGGLGRTHVGALLSQTAGGAIHGPSISAGLGTAG